uniref:DUF1640 domain-containing protein n=1 Tax=Meloidogyne hapla TaxID=6305 RepID=A0A1I8C1V4_MELHA
MDHDKTFFYEPSDGWANKNMHELRDTLTFEVHALRRDVDKQIKDLDTRITDLDKRVTDLDKRLSELTTKINQMETNLLAMESNLLAAVMDKKNYMLQVNWNKLLQFIHKFKKSLHFLCGDFYGIF